MRRFFIAILKQELMLIARTPEDWITPLIFFVLVIVIFPLSISPTPEILRIVAPGAIWAVALLASLLSQNNLFKQDYEDGTLTLLLLSVQPTILVVLAKCTAHWLSFGVPLIVLAPILGLWMHMQSDELIMLLISLPLGTGIFSLLATFSAALLVSSSNTHFISALIALPLCLPAIIFASATIYSTNLAPLLLLAALFTLFLTFLPLITSKTLYLNS